MAKYEISRTLTLQLFGFIYLCAFISWYVQIEGLYGLQGIFPLKSFLNSARANIGKNSTLIERLQAVPSITWLYGDLHIEPHALLQCSSLVGAFLSLLVIFNFSNSIIMTSLWCLYFSIFSIGQTFAGFQWDILLLEAGFLAILYAPLLNPRSKEEPSPIVRWMFRWLLFRLMFSSGVVKLTSNSEVWWNLTALNFHYETQCIPNSIAWYFAQLPNEFQKLSVAIMFFIEILVPFLIFIPTRFLNNINAFLQILLQLLIIATGNYTFFNILTITLCIPLLDDSVAKYFVFRRNRDDSETTRKSFIFQRFEIFINIFGVFALFGIVIDIYQTQYYLSWTSNSLHFFLKHSLKSSLYLGAGMTFIYSMKELYQIFSLKKRIISKILRLLHSLFIIGICALVFASSSVPFTGRLHRETSEKLPDYAKQAYLLTEKYHLTSSYGLFASMTTHRDEIIIEGTADGRNWKTYEFKYKPGDVNRPPPFVAPHQPRLDWQMWFAALGSYQYNPWYISLISRLLDGVESVVQLLDNNPFPEHPPIEIRSLLYSYHFSDMESGKNGSWWRREFKGEYMPQLNKQNPSLQQFLSRYPVAKPSKNFIQNIYLSEIHPLLIIGAFVIFLFCLFY